MVQTHVAQEHPVPWPVLLCSRLSHCIINIPHQRVGSSSFYSTSILLSANVPGKVVEDEPSAWFLATHVGDLGGALGFGLVQP